VLHTVVIPVLVTGIHLSACAGERGTLDPGNKCRDDSWSPGLRSGDL